MNISITQTLCLLSAAVVWGSGAYFIRVANYDALSSAWIRTGLSCLFLIPSSWAVIRNIKNCQWKAMAIVGLLTVASNYTWTTAVQLTSVANAVVLIYIFPFVGLFFDWVFDRKKPNMREVGFLSVMLTGLILIVGGVDLRLRLGDLLSLMCGVFWALMARVGNQIKDRKQYEASFFLGQASVTLLLAIWLIPPIVAQTKGMVQIVMALTFGLSAGAATLLYGKGSHQVSAHYIGPLSSIEAVVGIFLTWVFLNEKVTLLNAFGCFLVLIAAVLVMMSRRDPVADREKNDT